MANPTSAFGRRRPSRKYDDYDDLAAFVERGPQIDGDAADSRQLRERYEVELGSWAQMVNDLLNQLAADAGSHRHALELLNVPTTHLIDAWMHGAGDGASESALWMARSPLTRSETIALAPSVRILRGDDYSDLVEAAGSLAIAGDGALEPARLRRRYTVERSAWLRMIGDLLAQVVGDAGSIERAAVVLGVPETSLAEWVRWFVSKGSVTAASSRWPLAPIGNTPGAEAYLDLVEAIERGDLVVDDSASVVPVVRERYIVQLDSWEHMSADLLGQIIADAGSLRKAAKVLDVPRSTLGAWVSPGRRRVLRP